MDLRPTRDSVVLAIAPTQQGPDKSWVIDMSSPEYFLDWNEVSLYPDKSGASADQVAIQTTRMVTYFTEHAPQTRTHCIVIRSRTEFTQFISLCVSAKLLGLQDPLPPPPDMGMHE